MREFWLILKQAFWTKAKSTAFLVTTGLLIAGIFLLVNVPIILDRVSSVTGSDAREVVAVIADDATFAALSERSNASEEEPFEWVHVPKDEAGDAKARLLEEEWDAYVTIDEQDGVLHAAYATTKMADAMKPRVVEEALQSIQTERTADRLQLKDDEVGALLAPVVFETKNVSPSAKSEEELLQSSVLVYVLMFVIYFAVIMYSSMIATEVATEKSSRVMEIIISSASPVKHMFAKVFGIGLLGIVQLLLIEGAGYIAITKNKQLEQYTELVDFSAVNGWTIAYAFIFFLLGYFLYATLAALLGSLVSRIEDVQQMIMPMTLLIIIAFFISVFGMNNPEHAIVVWTSYIPFFAPLVMFLRVGLLDLPMWQPLLSISIMIATIVVLGVFGARIYRGGVLMYGPSRTLKDLKNAFRLGKE